MNANDTREHLDTLKARIPSMSREELERMATDALASMIRVAETDRTPDYRYSGSRSVDRLGRRPPDGQRWLTPSEIVWEMARRWKP